MAYFFQIINMKKKDLPELGLTDVVTSAQVTMVCDHLGARRLSTVDINFPIPTSANDFTPFSALSETQVQSWIENAMGADAVTDMYERLKIECDTAINGLQNVVSTPPWVSPSVE
jgi:hypothetical protein